MQIDSFVSCSLIKIQKGYNRRLIEYSHLVLVTQSAAKFEQVPCTMPETRLMLQSQKQDCLTSTNLTMIVMERARLMSSPVFEILTFANEFLNCCIKYRNEPFGGWQELSGLVESQEGGVPYVSNAGKERPVCFLKNNFFLRTLNTCICQSSCGY